MMTSTKALNWAVVFGALAIGSATVHAQTRSNVSIDRHSGLVEVKGMPAFSGKCDQGDWGAGRRF